jgi:hypothetical protein
MQRFAVTLFAIFMLAHAFLPALPVYVCTDGGRALDPCSPSEEPEAQSPDAKWKLGDCCKLTAPATVDASPVTTTNVAHDIADTIAILPELCTALLEPPICYQRVCRVRGPPLWRGHPSSLHTILRI